MSNTPPTYIWYLAGLVFAWLKEQGGLDGYRRAQRAQGGKIVCRHRKQ